MLWSALLVAAGESAPGAHRLLSRSVCRAVWLLEAPFPPGQPEQVASFRVHWWIPPCAKAGVGAADE